jgi:site-specific recombinase XerD
MRSGEMEPTNKGKRYPAETLTTAEVDALLGAISGRGSTALRNRAPIATMYRGALRVAEALALRPSDIDPETGELHIREGKGGRSRKVKLDPGALELVNVWRERRAQLDYTGRQPLFCGIKGETGGGELKTAYVRRLLPQLAERAGIEKRVHAHGLRHSRAAELAAGGVPVNVIQQALGHTSLSTTNTYLSHVHPGDVFAAMDSDWKPTVAA